MSHLTDPERAAFGRVDADGVRWFSEANVEGMLAARDSDWSVCDMHGRWSGDGECPWCALEDARAGVAEPSSARTLAAVINEAIDNARANRVPRRLLGAVVASRVQGSTWLAETKTAAAHAALDEALNPAHGTEWQAPDGVIHRAVEEAKGKPPAA